MSFSEHNHYLPRIHPRANFAPRRTTITGIDMRALYESRAVDRTCNQMTKRLAPSFSEHLRRFEKTLEANLAIFCGAP